MSRFNGPTLYDMVAKVEFALEPSGIRIRVHCNAFIKAAVHSQSLFVSCINKGASGDIVVTSKTIAERVPKSSRSFPYNGQSRLQSAGLMNSTVNRRH